VANQTLERMEFGTSFNQVLQYYSKRGIAVNPGIALFGKASANMEGSLRLIAPELVPFDVFRDTLSGILGDQVRQLNSGSELLRMANEAFMAGRSMPEQLRYMASSIVNGQYVLRVRDDTAMAHEAREDARARALRRTLWGITALVLWHDRHRRRS
jgi:ubiquinone biosynthesis protein